MATILFRRIEDNFYLKNLDRPQTVLANIQLSLIQYFKVKLLNDLEHNIDYHQILNSLDFYENMLITKEGLVINKKNPNNYILLDESIQKFYQLKEEVLLFISEKEQIDNQSNLSIK